MKVEFTYLKLAVMNKQGEMFDKLMEENDKDFYGTIKKDKQYMYKRIDACSDVPELVEAIVELGYDLEEAYEYIINSIMEE